MDSRAQLIKSRSIRRENQATVDKLKNDLAVCDDGSAESLPLPSLADKGEPIVDNSRRGMPAGMSKLGLSGIPRR